MKYESEESDDETSQSVPGSWERDSDERSAAESSNRSMDDEEWSDSDDEYEDESDNDQAEDAESVNAGR